MTLASDAARALTEHLLDAKHHEDDGASFLRDLAAKLVDLDMPIWRVSYALMTKHPEVLWRTVQWRAGEEVVVQDQPHARINDAFYTDSPVALARTETSPVRMRLGADVLPFALGHDLRAQGGTDYVAYGLPFSNGEVSYVSFATKAEGGFSPELLETLDQVRPVLARRLELESAYYATHALLDVYLGHNAARRVLGGAFQRGRGELIDAAIWFSDMRGFTSLSDGSEPAEVIEVLDRYFDAVASAIAAHGGEVLKFIGDAVMAIFPLGVDPRDACNRALAAARDAFAALDLLNQERAARGEPAVGIGVGLHRGTVMYGNIGARDRLDFTVISSAVNEASRLEALTKSLGVTVALSEEFAGSTDSATIDLGTHTLKGVKRPLRVFGIAESPSHR